MSIQNKLIKRMGILFVLLIMIVTVFSTTVASAATYNFNLDIKAGGTLCRTEDKHLRNTSSIQKAWGVILEYSNEVTGAYPDGSAKTATTFWLGIDNPYGTNPLGSGKYNVTEGKGWCYFAAYAAASNKYVYLYASDNSQTNKMYSVSGKWCPYSGNLPGNA